MNYVKENLKDRLDEKLSVFLDGVNESALKDILIDQSKYQVVNWKTDEKLDEEFSSKSEAKKAIVEKINEGFQESDFILVKVGQDG